MEAVSLFSRFRIDVLLVSPSAEILQRIVQVTERLKLSAHRVYEVSDYEKNFSEIGRPNVVILDLSLSQESTLALEKIFQLKTIIPHSHFIALVGDSQDALLVQKLSDAGVDQVHSSTDVLCSVKIDFLLMHEFLLKFYPIDLRDLFPGTEITFNAFHYMSLNNKYLPVIFERFVLTDKKFKRLEKIKQIYIQNNAAPAYQKYIESYYDAFNVGLQKRMKASFLQLMMAYTDVRCLIMSEKKEETTIKLPQLLNFCEEAHAGFVKYIKMSPQPFQNYVQIFRSHELSKFDRNLFIAGLASFLAEMSGVAQAAITLKSSILAFSGMMYTDYKTYLKWHDQLEAQWKEDDYIKFTQALNVSSEAGQIEGIDLDGSIAASVAHLFERFDGHGQPRQAFGEQIPLEAVMIQLADGWLREIYGKRLSDSEDLYESFKTFLAIEKRSGKINPSVIEKMEQIKFRKA